MKFQGRRDVSVGTIAENERAQQVYEKSRRQERSKLEAEQAVFAQKAKYARQAADQLRQLKARFALLFAEAAVTA